MIIDRFYQNFKDSFYHEVPVKHPEALSDFRKAEFGEKSLQQKRIFQSVDVSLKSEQQTNLLLC